MNKCVGIVKKSGVVCGCKAKYEGLYCGRHKAQGDGKTDFGRDLIDCFVCCRDRVRSLTMPCCGNKLCPECAIKSYVYADTCVFCRHKLKVSFLKK